MARMFPELGEDDLRALERTSFAEADVYRAFRDHTPPRLLVRHGLDLIARAPGDPPRDAEADFVVCDPKRGVLIIEVKGGGIERDARGKWWSTSRGGVHHSIKDPIRQAKGNKYAILDDLKDASGWGPGGAPRLLMAHAALFPDLSDITGLVGSDRPRAILGCHTDVQNLASWVDQVFMWWSKNDGEAQPLGDLGLRVAERRFCGSVVLSVPMALAIEREQRRQIELTKRQARLLINIRGRVRASVAGAAGTGKTVLAIEHARKLAAQGKHTLLICYNRALADFLNREVAGTPNLDALSFHQLCDWRIREVMRSVKIDLMEEAGREYPGGDPYDLLRPHALALTTEYDPRRWDAIVIDEGQDFGDEYWLPIDCLLRDVEASELVVFFDPNQAIYRRSASFPKLGPPLLLTENCRNTHPIHDAAYIYYKGDEVVPPELEGEPITPVQVETLAGQARSIRELVTRLMQVDGLKPEDIVVLLVGEGKEAHYRALLNAGTPGGFVWEAERLWQPGAVLVDTTRRFKGLEATAVILWCSETIPEETEGELLYVALSRARSRLWVIGPSQQVNRVLRVAP